MSTHYLKTWPEFFAKVLSQEKHFEIRKNDRRFVVDDILVLQEYVPEERETPDLPFGYTGRTHTVKVAYILFDYESVGLMEGYCALSLVQP